MSTAGITGPAGFSAGATTAGIKPSGTPDMALVVNNGPCFDAAAVFTRNRVVASPVKLSRKGAKRWPACCCHLQFWQRQCVQWYAGGQGRLCAGS